MHTVLLLMLAGCGEWEREPFARAFVIEDLADGIGGPKAVAQPGDFLLENDQIRVAIVGPRHSMGPGLFGGGLVDADLQRLGGEWTRGRGNDQFAEMFATVNMNVTHATEEGEVVIVADGSDGGPAIVRAIARDEPFITLLGGLWALIGAPRFNISTDYILEPGARYVRMETTVWAISTGASAAQPDAPPDNATMLDGTDELEILTLALEEGLAFGDFYLQGGSVDVFAPGLGFDEDGAVFEETAAGRNTFQDPFVLDFIAGTADRVSYGLATLDGQLFVPLFTSSQTAGFGAGVRGNLEGDRLFEPTEAFTYARIFAIGDGDVGSIYDTVLTARAEALGADAVPTGELRGVVLEEGTGDAVSGAHVFVYRPGDDKPWSQFETDVGHDDTTPDGSFGGLLPPGDYELVVHERGHPETGRVPVTITDGKATGVALELPRAGEVTFRVVDERGIIVPSKVTIMPADGAAVRDPVLGDGYIAGDPEAVLFCPYGECRATLPPGDYEAYATRGPEYELGFATFSVSANHPAYAELQVIHAVDSTGWISADFHVHTNPSHDSGVTPIDRVFTMASENVELMVSSDHDFVTDFRPVIEDLGLEPWIASDVGVEVTTVEVGHYIGFPVVHDYLADAGGAFDWTGMTPEEMIEGLHEMGRVEDPLTFVAHPRDGILGYFDQYGFSPYEGTPGNLVVDAGLITITNLLLSPDNFTTDFDALELLNGKRFDFVRTPTLQEMDDYAADGSVTGYDVLERTFQEQQELIDGVYTFGPGRNGQVDDWFSLLNLGYRYTAIGNSDTHSKTSTESGCPRNFVVSDTDDPAFIDSEEIARQVQAGHVFTSYGPFVRFMADDRYIMGDELSADGAVDFYIEVQSPSWFNVDRVELYRNGELVKDWQLDVPNADTLNLAVEWSDTPDIDAWYAVIVMGDDDLYPLYTPVEYPPVQLQDVITEALSSVPAVSNLLSAIPPHPRDYPVYPFALTNPIFVDVDGDTDGDGELWEPPGLPVWLGDAAPVEE
ncbi:MAG: carboxypeptidase regulatory-like domain-containing protein [Alphaproteobacteria bacterium]|nr:carboxypeptidase regulatory-like domain-containing protein [Alphaproteobacteria bacterium]